MSIKAKVVATAGLLLMAAACFLTWNFIFGDFVDVLFVVGLLLLLTGFERIN